MRKVQYIGKLGVVDVPELGLKRVARRDPIDVVDEQAVILLATGVWEDVAGGASLPTGNADDSGDDGETGVSDGEEGDE